MNRRSARQRGGAYLLVLTTAMIVTMLGLSALMLGRVETRAVNLRRDQVRARSFGRAAAEIAMQRIAADPNWRTTYTSNVWTADETVDGVTFSFKLVDEVDNNLANDVTHDVRLYTRATCGVTASAGGATRLYSVKLTRDPAGTGAVTTSFDKRVVASTDDAEQLIATGLVALSDNNLDLVEGIVLILPVTDIAGMRFTGVTIPRNATITTAYIQFRCRSTSSSAAALTINGQAADDPTWFTALAFNISGRPLTGATVPWAPPAWNTVNAAGANERTPDLSPIVREIVSRTGWNSGQSMVMIIKGSGTRNAYSYDGSAASAPLLHIEWTQGGAMIPVTGTWRQEVLP